MKSGGIDNEGGDKLFIQILAYDAVSPGEPWGVLNTKYELWGILSYKVLEETHLTSDHYILIAAWVVTVIVLIAFVPKTKIRDALVIFLLKQLITWPLGLAVAELSLIEYPTRLFPYATRTCFSFEYFIYPAICVLFLLYYPERKTRLRQLLHYVVYCTGITVVEVICERYTNIIKYTGWTWYYTWISLFITFYLTRVLYIWFRKRPLGVNQ